VSALVIDGLDIRYGDLHAVQNLSLEVRRGEVLVLLGSNGAGKTSTIECAQGLRSASAGTVRLLGLDPQQDHEKLMPRIGVMLQDGGLPPAGRPGELLGYYQRLYGRPCDQELLDLVGLSERSSTNVRRLSGGEKQRLSLALSLVAEPEVLFLDEPTSGVDAQGRRLIREIVANQRNADTAVVLTSHELDEAERMADRIAIMHKGSLMALGTLDELLAKSSGVRFKAAAGLNLAGLGAALSSAVIETEPGKYVIHTERSAQSLAEVTTWFAENSIEIHELLSGRESLEDLFLRITGDEQ
jgi:ABC-2 type transport system ATP-binding protein